MSIQTANVVPNFLTRRKIDAQDLRRLQEPVVLFEYEGLDSDGERYYVYTVAGFLDGKNICTAQGGATVGGDVITIHADTRENADAIACLGLYDTINMLDQEEKLMLEATAAKARLGTIGALDRMDLANRKDKPDAFVEDMDKLTVLRGDDIIVASGH